MAFPTIPAATAIGLERSAMGDNGSGGGRFGVVGRGEIHVCALGGGRSCRLGTRGSSRSMSPARVSAPAISISISISMGKAASPRATATNAALANVSKPTAGRGDGDVVGEGGGVGVDCLRVLR